MANLLIKPTTGVGNKLIIQDQNGGDILTSADSGANITATISNLTTFTSDLIVVANTNMMVAGPVTIPNLTINGNLNVTQVLNITTEMNMGTNGSLNMVG